MPASRLAEELFKELKVRHSKLTASQLSLLFRVLAVLTDRITSGTSGVARRPLVLELKSRLLSMLEKEVKSKSPTLELLAGTVDVCACSLHAMPRVLVGRSCGRFTRLPL